jgi:hypothetical protein
LSKHVRHFAIDAVARAVPTRGSAFGSSAFGIPDMHGQTRPLPELLLHGPPAVAAGMLGCTPGPTEAGAEAGATWKHDAAGDHSRN